MAAFRRFRLVTSAALAATLVRSMTLNVPCGLRVARGMASKAAPSRSSTTRVLASAASGPAEGTGDGSSSGEWKPPAGFAVWDDSEDPVAIEEEASTRRARSSGEAGGAAPEERRRSGPDSNPLQLMLEMPKGFCSGCGVRYQSSNELAPGFVPPSVLAARLAAADDDSEIRVADADEVPEYKKPKKNRPITCQRCHALRFQNRLPADTLRVGGGGRPDVEGSTGHEELNPAHFRALLRSLRYKQCIIVCLVDLFDFHGSLVPELGSIVAEGNPLMLVANKVDLIPRGVRPAAIERWVRTECKRAALPPITTLDLVSARTGEGMPQFLHRLEKLMSQRRMDVYVLGAANAGKSTLLNYVLDHSSSQRFVDGRAAKKGAQEEMSQQLTTSHLPGTTLGFVKMALMGNSRNSIYDTPGLILPNQLTTLLTTEELAGVVPKKRGQPVSLRLCEGQTLLLGGLARIHMREGRPFLFTLYLANAVAVHPTKREKVDEMLAKHVGGMLTPPSSLARLEELGEFEEHVVEVSGRGWNEVAVDLVLPGLGWIAVTGSGSCSVGVELPKPVRVVTREPLLPDEGWKKSSSKFTGSKLIDSKGNTKRVARARK